MSKDKEPVSAKRRMGAVLIGAVVGFVGFVMAEAGANADSASTSMLGGWLLFLGGLFALVNLGLAGWRLMRDG